MFIGRYRKGDVVPLYFISKTAAGVPTLPDAVPSIILYSDTASVATKFVPVKDRYLLTAFFHFPLQLDGDFATAGHYRAVFNFIIGGTALRDQAEFEVMSLGDVAGQGLAIGLMETQAADYVLMQTYLGTIKRFKNPRSVS